MRRSPCTSPNMAAEVLSGLKHLWHPSLLYVYFSVLIETYYNFVLNLIKIMILEGSPSPQSQSTTPTSIVNNGNITINNLVSFVFFCTHKALIQWILFTKEKFAIYMIHTLGKPGKMTQWDMTVSFIISESSNVLFSKFMYLNLMRIFLPYEFYFYPYTYSQ